VLIAILDIGVFPMKSDAKEKILAAAALIFLKRGFEETTMANIAKEAGLTQPAIYIHYKNKMDLMKNICLWSAQKGRDFIDKKIINTDPACKRFEAYIDANFEFFRHEKIHVHSMMALYFFSLTNSEIFEAFKIVQETGVKRIQTYLAQGNHEGTWYLANTQTMADVIHSYLIGECYKAIYFKKENSFEKFKRRGWATVVRIINSDSK
jgi:AcrR family transcriptional regulator